MSAALILDLAAAGPAPPKGRPAVSDAGAFDAALALAIAAPTDGATFRPLGERQAGPTLGPAASDLATDATGAVDGVAGMDASAAPTGPWPVLTLASIDPSPSAPEPDAAANPAATAANRSPAPDGTDVAAPRPPAGEAPVTPVEGPASRLAAPMSGAGEFGEKAGETAPSATGRAIAPASAAPAPDLPGPAASTAPTAATAAPAAASSGPANDARTGVEGPRRTSPDLRPSPAVKAANPDASGAAGPAGADEADAGSPTPRPVPATTGRTVDAATAAAAIATAPPAQVVAGAGLTATGVGAAPVRPTAPDAAPQDFGSPGAQPDRSTAAASVVRETTAQQSPKPAASPVAPAASVQAAILPPAITQPSIAQASIAPARVEAAAPGVPVQAATRNDESMVAVRPVVAPVDAVVTPSGPTAPMSAPAVAGPASPAGIDVRVVASPARSMADAGAPMAPTPPQTPAAGPDPATAPAPGSARSAIPMAAAVEAATLLAAMTDRSADGAPPTARPEAVSPEAPAAPAARLETPAAPRTDGGPRLMREAALDHPPAAATASVAASGGSTVAEDARPGSAMPVPPPATSGEAGPGPATPSVTPAPVAAAAAEGAPTSTSASASATETPAPGASANPAPLSPPEAAVGPQVGTAARADPAVQVAAQIARRIEGRSTRFDMALTPEDLGRVDVSLEVGADGQLAARLAFDNPAAAAELRGRADELRRQLEQAGFVIAHDGLSFSDRQGSGDRPNPRFARAAAFGERIAADAEGAAVARWTPPALAAGRIDVRI